VYDQGLLCPFITQVIPMHRRWHFAFVFLAMCAALLGLSRWIWVATCADATPSQDKQAVEIEKTQPITAHPLDPLTEEELKTAVSVVRAGGKLAKEALFPLLALHEPTRQELEAPGQSLHRKAAVVALDRSANATFEAVVDLEERKILTWKQVPNVQPAVLIEEYESADKIVRQDPRWKNAMAQRKIDTADVQLDAWAAGYMGAPELKGARLLRVLSYLRSKATNAYARPIEGVVALVNMNTKKVIDLVDRPAPTPEPAADFFDAKIAMHAAAGLSPLETRQPMGPSFKLNGHEVRWQNWVFRYGFHPREGLVLYTVGWNDGKSIRPIVHRASISEMLVPYGDPDADWSWRNAFDMGEYGLGQLSISLRAGQEVPQHATLLSATLADDEGSPQMKKDVIALFEQDGGMLWTHTDYKTNKTTTRRGQQFVVQSVFTVGNYDYGLRWIFHQDGTLEAQTELTGVLLAKGVRDEQCQMCQQAPDLEGKLIASGEERFGKLVAKNVLAPYHQHFFCFRLDMNVDGGKNSVYEMNVRPEAALASNPLQNGFLVEYQLLRSEREARRNLDFAAHRSWKVLNPNKKTALGHFPAYTLEPGPSSVPYLSSQSRVRRRAGFLDHPLWVTRSRPGEFYAAGDYPNQSAGGDGLPRWIDKNESIVNEAIVLWHTLGVTHIPRVEEWPIMPVSHVGFRLVPDGFFGANTTVGN
jgi:primary-amine oxidase